MNPFYVPGAGPYVLTHSVGCLPRVSRDALEKGFMQPWEEGGGAAWPVWLQRIDEFRSTLADLFGNSLGRCVATTPISDDRDRGFILHDEAEILR